jgi:mannose-1-phosphate guanylyltransferase
MRGFILAAGFGTRMKPLTDHIPKALVPVCGKPLLEHALQFLTSSGITDIGVNAHYMPDQMLKFQKSTLFPFELFVESGEIRGTGGAFDNARAFLQGDTSFLILNVDIICQFDLKAAIAAFEASDALCTLIAFPCSSGKGTVLFDQLTKKYIGTPADTPHRPQGVADAAFIGAALYKKEFLDFVTTDDFSIVPVWKRAIELGATVSVSVQGQGFWRDIGTLKALADVHREFLNGTLSFDLSDDYHYDKVRKSVYPLHCKKLVNESLECAWVGTPLFEGASIKNSIIWPGTDVREMKIINTLYTHFGALEIS